jgi:hypothetical protein
MTAATAAACRRCATPLEIADLRCCICALATGAGTGLAAATAAPAARILRCKECSAAIAYVVEHQAPHCGFCGSVMEVEQPVDPVEQAQWILPFLVDRGVAGAALARWLGSLGWFRPGDLASAATIEQLEPLHWAAWVFDVDAHVTWAADSDAGARRAAWAPHSGTATFSWRDVVVSASRGLSLAETARLGSGYRLDTAGAIDAGHAGGAAAGGAIETFDTQRSAARRKIVDAIEAIAERALTEQGHIPGSRFRKVHASVLLSRLHTRRTVLPSWVLAYRYKGALYRSVVHGQDDSIVFGDAPYSFIRIALAVLAGLAVVAFAAAVFLR